MARKATSIADVILGEATYGTEQERFDDMLSIASVISNRAMQTGTTLQSVISAPNQFQAYGKALPKGVDAYRSLAEAALAEVLEKGPVTAATYYATPKTRSNLPAGLQNVHVTKGHVFAVDPQNRPIATAQGYVTPSVNVAEAAPVPTPAPRGMDAVGYAPTAPEAPAVEAINAALGTTTPDAPSASMSAEYASPMGMFGDRITSAMGGRTSPMGIGSTNHRGVDMTAALGRGQIGAPVNAVAGGVVSYAGPAGGYGNMVEITHDDGSRSRYAHLGDPNPDNAKYGPAINVEVGQRIAKGHPVGILGNTGISTGPHLHFEMVDPFGKHINPTDVVDFAQTRDVPTPTAANRAPETMAGRVLDVPASIAPTTTVPGEAPAFTAASDFGINMGLPGYVAGVPANSVQTTSISPGIEMADLSQPSSPSARSAQEASIAAYADGRIADAFASAPAAPSAIDAISQISPTANLADATQEVQAKAPSNIAATYSQFADTMQAAGLSSAAGLAGRTPAQQALADAHAYAGKTKGLAPANPVTATVAPAAPAVAQQPAYVAPQAPVAVPAIAAPIAQVAQATAKAQTPSAPPAPSGVQASYDFYSGKANEATSSTGAQLSRDVYGNTYNYSPEFDVTTISNKRGDIAGAKSGKHTGAKSKGKTGASFGINFGKNPEVAGQVGTLAGTVIGGLVAGPIGGIIGGRLGRSIALSGVPAAPSITSADFARSMAGYQSGLAFPDAPSASGNGGWGGWTDGSGPGSRDFAESISPGAADAIDAGKGGLY